TTTKPPAQCQLESLQTNTPSTSSNLLRHFFFSGNVSACSERAAQYKHPQKNVNTFEETLLTKKLKTFELH
ncbi:hypothetical protein, partial [Zoogloea sp.]|uniref:hypothetical protein n=1 Tax=Zoogloea sp. TaxID=49181 RepID=UPI00260E93ED